MKSRSMLATFAITSLMGVLIVACGSSVKNEGGHTPGTDGGPSAGGGNSGGASAGGTNGAGGTRIIGTGGSAFDAGSVPSSPPLGMACLVDTDCGPALKCLQSTSSDFLGGGPPNGFCTLDCTADFNSSTLPASTPDSGLGVCRTLALDSVCLGAAPSSVLQGKAFCVPGCTVGTSAGAECQNRLDVVCTPANPGTGDPRGYCSPRCRNDADCGSRTCDLLQGVCVDAGSTSGLPVGASCTGSGADPCAGFCFPIDTSSDAGQLGPGFCSAPCRLGTVGCGATTTNPTAACLFGGATSVQGDEGACAPLCNCNDVCVAGLVCRPFTSAAERTAYGTKGYCGDAIDSQTGGAAVNIPCASTSKDAGARDSGVSLDAASAGDAR